MSQSAVPIHTLLSIVNFIGQQHPEVASALIHRRREYLSTLIMDLHQGKVAHGPFAGLKLHKNSHWSLTDKASMILGLYEEEILNSLAQIKGRYKTFIDLGAADGYYGIGALVGGLFETTYCFEMNPDSQELIKESAQLNNVSDRVHVFGKAEANFFERIPSEDLASSVLFVDIEGAEFSLFSSSLFHAFSRSKIYIELHDWLFPNANDLLHTMQRQCSETHIWTDVRTGLRDPGRFPELRDMSDTDRWLICSEGRARLMKWAVLEPLI